MGADKRRLAAFLKEISDWDWYRFLQAEADEGYTTRQSVVFATVRAAAMEDPKAIIVTLGRIDGKVETPVQVVTPKIWFLYPNATETATVIEGTALEKAGPDKALTVLTEEEAAEEMPSRSIRQTMERMADQDRGLPGRIVRCQERWEDYFHNRGRAPEETVKVSSVIAARLLRMAQKRDPKALEEVFDQLDGKLVETVRIVGEDMYISMWGSVAPVGAERNADGVWQVEAPNRMTQMWGERLDPKSITRIIEE